MRFGFRKHTEEDYLRELDEVLALRQEIVGLSQFSSDLFSGEIENNISLQDWAAIPTSKTVAALNNNLLSSIGD